jgi:hypothetical protein
VGDDLVGLDRIAQAQTAEESAAHRAGRERLLAALAALEGGELGLPAADLTVALTALAILRLWARWLRQFAGSSAPYLLAQFIQRPGRFYRRADGLLIELERRPLDLVLDIAGYTADLERVPWLGGQKIRFQVQG